MKKAGLCVLLLFVLFAGVLQARTWHYGKSRTCEGEFLGVKTENGEEKVRIRQDSNGNPLLLKWELLSGEDRAYVQQQTQAPKTMGETSAMPAGNVSKSMGGGGKHVPLRAVDWSKPIPATD